MKNWQVLSRLRGSCLWRIGLQEGAALSSTGTPLPCLPEADLMAVAYLALLSNLLFVPDQSWVPYCTITYHDLRSFFKKMFHFRLVEHSHVIELAIPKGSVFVEQQHAIKQLILSEDSIVERRSGHTLLTNLVSKKLGPFNEPECSVKFRQKIPSH